jgi:hypothetical protein
MSEHRLTPEGIRKARRIALRRTVMLFVIVAGFIFYFAFSKSGSLGFAFVMAGLMMLMLAFSAYRSQKLAAAKLASYVVFLDDERIRCVITGMPDIEVTRSDVTAIEERRPGGLAVYGRERRNFVGINDDMDGYAAIRDQLLQWRSFDERKPASFLIAIVATILTVTAFGVTILSHDRMVVASVGSGLVIALIVCAVMVLRSPHVDRKTKRTMFFLVLPIAAIVARIAFALSGADLPR